MARKGQFVRSTDGIVEGDVERTIENFSRLGNEGSAAMDELMLRMMLGKNRQDASSGCH
jgi:L-cysteine desulfidase